LTAHGLRTAAAVQTRAARYRLWHGSGTSRHSRMAWPASQFGRCTPARVLRVAPRRWTSAARNVERVLRLVLARRSEQNCEHVRNWNLDL